MKHYLCSEINKLWSLGLSHNEIKTTLIEKYPNSESDIKENLSSYVHNELYAQNKKTIILLKILILIAIILSLKSVLGFIVLGFSISEGIGIIFLLISVSILFKYFSSLLSIFRGEFAGFIAINYLSVLNIVISIPSKLQIVYLIPIIILNLIILALNYPTLKKLRDENKTRQETPVQISQAEASSKTYIRQYKNQYSKKAIKNALTDSGISEKEVEIYLAKYY